ncbi:GH3 auxin-responsive promoter family protein [Thermocoleostomius sinensis]|uniref:GH3 auxin-responsive promoter family protein n=1 Tax=Thermocoleostomius sinensis A174 TaxID=2016057 RepID=A0A9E8ZIJ4_9CYAN|nr:GH3 auxin-responsive promoter family protein [Thermocoleostomius sinensis]WAL62337.1 GH3 auxin-responsive promoter family protein [Thermocoleostomius sinensis A174]
MSTLMLSLAAAVSKQVKTRFIRQTHHAEAAQDAFLRTLLQAHCQTEFGRELGLVDIKTIDQFRDRVPISSYSDYEPYIDRIAKGERNILTPDPVIYLSLTSGSTGKQKLIPITPRSRRFRSYVNQVSAGFIAEAAQRHQRPLGKMLLTSSLQLVGHTSSGIPYGPISAGDLRLNSTLYRQVFAHPFDALKPADSLARHYVCLLFALGDPQTRVIGANFPVLALRLADYLESYADDLIHDLETGEIASWLKLEPELRAKLERRWFPNPNRAAELRHILKTEGRLTPRSAWNLSLLITARGGTSNFYFERFPAYFGNTPIFGGLYASSEAAFGSYYDFNQDGAILAIDTGFFEFIPEDQWYVSQPQTVLASEVIPSQCYRILVTNYNGLYRYDIGDVVEVLGFYNQAPIIVFRHRLGGMLSSITEKTTEFHVMQVMQQLQQEFHVTLENFCITLSEQDIPPHYLVNIELAPGSLLPDPVSFIHQFDRHLQAIHTSYAIKRPDQIPAPRLRILAPGSFAILRQRLLQRGIPESQLKFPHISNDRQFLAGLTIEQEVEVEEVKDDWARYF